MFLIAVGFGGTYDIKNKCERVAFHYTFNVISTDFDYRSRESCVRMALTEARGSIKPSWIDEIKIIFSPMDPNDELVTLHHKHLSCQYYTCYENEEACQAYRKNQNETSK